MIVGKRIRLRAVEKTDLPKFQDWLNDSEVTAGLSQYLPLSSRDEERWYEGTGQRTPEERPLAIEAQRGRTWELIGNAGLFGLHWPNRSAEFGIFIGDKTKWNRGYGTEALQLMLQHGFGTLNLHRIFLHVLSSNPRARRSYEKAGFVHEGTLREAAYRDGRYIDIEIMGILREEWNRRQEGA